MEENIDQVIESLKTLYTSLQVKANKENKETQTITNERRVLTGFNILPKKILRKIFLFLDFVQDIPQICLTCKLFSLVIRSRTYQVLLHTQASLKHSKLYNSSLMISTSDEEIPKVKPENEIKTKEDAISQLKIAEAVKAFLAAKIKKQAKRNDDLEKEIFRLQEEIKAQKNLYSKGIERTTEVEKRFEIEKKGLYDAQRALVSLQTKCKQDIEPLKAQILSSEKDRLEMKETKLKLKSEVLEMRKSNVELHKKIVVYQEVLNKIKAYFEAMQEASLLKSSI